jgi:Domain of unknown function (DUF4915)
VAEAVQGTVARRRKADKVARVFCESERDLPRAPTIASIWRKHVRFGRHAVADGVRWVVNAGFSCLCTLDRSASFAPPWRPPFVTALEPTDRCHLNGLAMEGGRPRYVTALVASLSITLASAAESGRGPESTNSVASRPRSDSSLCSSQFECSHA